VIVEQHAQKILSMTHRAVILERGTIVHSGPSAALIDDTNLLERHLGVTRRGAVSMRATGLPP
jgi:branched-chain amino acid transport system ATP-binding protein